MVDREKVIKGLRIVSRMLNEMGRRNEMDIVDDALAILKEDCHKCKLECLLQKYDELKEKYDAMLKKQETIPVYEDRINKCECGETICRYWHPKFCGFCGRELLWY